MTPGRATRCRASRSCCSTAPPAGPAGSWSASSGPSPARSTAPSRCPLARAIAATGGVGGWVDPARPGRRRRRRRRGRGPRLVPAPLGPRAGGRPHRPGLRPPAPRADRPPPRPRPPLLRPGRPLAGRSRGPRAGHRAPRPRLPQGGPDVLPRAGSNRFLINRRDSNGLSSGVRITPSSTREINRRDSHARREATGFGPIALQSPYFSRSLGESRSMSWARSNWSSHSATTGPSASSSGGTSPVGQDGPSCSTASWRYRERVRSP